MRRLRIGCAVFAVWFGVMPVWGQSRPRLAVLPLNPINVARADAEVVSGLLETALVKTEAYDVIEQREVSAVLEAQERSVSDCTDEKCAIAFGKLLAAEQIVLGTLSAIGGKYVLNAKIIDVALGKNIKADTVEVVRLDEVTQAAELLAFKLAGLTYRSGQEVQIAQAFGEVFIETDPPGGEILINGVRKGTSPELISRVPLGKIRVEARKDNLYAMEELEVTAKTGMLKLKLERQFGNLFIKSGVTGVDVYLDGRKLGPLGSGFFQDLEAGDHALALQGDGLYWEGSVTISRNESTRVEAYPREYGSLAYELPEGVIGEVTGANAREVIRGAGTLRMPAGAYSVRLSGSGIDAVVQSVEIRKAQTEQFRPALVLTRAAEERSFTERLTRAEKELQESQGADDALIARLEAFAKEIGESRHGFPDLAARADALVEASRDRRQRAAASARNEEAEKTRAQRIEELTRRREELQTQLLAAQNTGGKRLTRGLVFLGLFGGAGILGGVAKVVATNAYAAYGAAETTAEAVLLRRKTQTWDRVFVVSLSGAGLSGLVSLLSLAGRPKPAVIAEALRDIDEELAALRGGTR